MLKAGLQTEEKKMGLKGNLILNHSRLHNFCGVPVTGPKECLTALSHVKLPKVLEKIFSDSVKGIFFKTKNTHKNYNVDATYDDGYIYIKEDLVDPDLILQVLIHEVSHLLQDTFPERFLENGDIINEFSLKRIELMRRLSKRGYNLDRKAFLRLTYDPMFDTFLNNEIKEEDLKDCIKGLFPSPYSALSLDEYIAIIFEEFFENPEVAREYSKEICDNIKKVMADYYDSKF